MPKAKFKDVTTSEIMEFLVDFKDNVVLNFNKLEKRVDNLEVKVDNLETKVDSLDKKVHNIESDYASKDFIEDKFDFWGAQVGTRMNREQRAEQKYRRLVNKVIKKNSLATKLEMEQLEKYA